MSAAARIEEGLRILEQRGLARTLDGRWWITAAGERWLADRAGARVARKRRLRPRAPVAVRRSPSRRVRRAPGRGRRRVRA